MAKSSTKIGCAWFKVADSGQEYYPIALNKELLPLTITENHSVTMFPIADENRKDENSPHFSVVLSLKEGKNANN